MKARIYCGPQDDAHVDLAVLTEEFDRRHHVQIEFIGLVVKDRMLGRAPLLVIDGELD